MNEYDGFNTVDDPREYMNAPARNISDRNGNTASPTVPPPRLPLIVQAAIEYTAGYKILSTDELQGYYSEQSALQRRHRDISGRLEVEFKMREAAQSLSKLHAEEETPPSANPNRASKRLSKLWNVDTHPKNERRLSRQAADEAAISSAKIADLEKQLGEVDHRRATVDRTIMQHHASVLARSLTNRPLPNHQRNRSNCSTVSLSVPNSNNRQSPGPSTPRSGTPSSLTSPDNRQSWILAPKHQRQWSATSNDAASLATVTEHPEAGRRRGIVPSSSPASSAYDEELDALTAKIAQAYPRATSLPPPQEGKVAYIAQAFEAVVHELYDARNSLEAAKIQVDHSEHRIQYLDEQLRNQTAMRSRSIDSIHFMNSMKPNESRELQRELDNERSSSVRRRNRAEQQRVQLANTNKSLDEVTRMAVEFESERSDFQQLIAELQAKLSRLEEEKVTLLQQRLGASVNNSLLCQEFQQIVSDLVSRHETEVRSLYPKFKSGSTTDLRRTSAIKYPRGSIHGSVHGSINVATSGGSRGTSRVSSPPGQLVVQKTRPMYNADIRTTSDSSRLSALSGRVRGLSQSSVISTPADIESRSISQRLSGISHGISGGMSSLPIKNIPNTPSKDMAVVVESADTSMESEIPPPRHLNFHRDNTYDDSIQRTTDEVMKQPGFDRPDFERQNSEISEYSKTSSYSPDGEVSANPSQMSFRPSNASQSSFRPTNGSQHALPSQHNIPTARSEISVTHSATALRATRGNVRAQSFEFDSVEDDELL